MRRTTGVDSKTGIFISQHTFFVFSPYNTHIQHKISDADSRLIYMSKKNSHASSQQVLQRVTAKGGQIHNFEERLKKLNPEQRKAVETIEGPLLVVAGPGSGKTEILSMRVAEILKKTHAQPSNILCLTFTDSAAINMRERLAKLIGDPAYQVGIHTFHNFCVDVMRKYGEFFYQGATFSPADEVLQISVLESIFNNLAHDNPLKSYHPTEGYVYLKSVLQSISHLKKAGLTPDEFAVLVEDNASGVESIHTHLVPVLERRLSKHSVDEIQDALNLYIEIGVVSAQTRRADIVQRSESKVALGLKNVLSMYKPVEEAIALSLTEALGYVRETGKNDALSNWKKKWLKKDDQGQTVFRDFVNYEKMQSLAQIYRLYQESMYRAGYFDFDDMIIDVIKVMYQKPELRYMLQEQFQYLLVDEFQDTNNAQMRILTLLTDATQNNGRPNIMVVGDDDQAIYKFQGAELSNILDFKDRYTDVSTVSLVRNYRSTQDILNIAMSIVRKGEKRLENIIPDLSKQLIASGNIETGNIEYIVLETSLHEYTYVTEKIKALISGQNEQESGGTKDIGNFEPKDIAIIARKHGQLESLVPYLRKATVPIRYEREQNVFEEPHIKQLITIATYVSSLVSAWAHESPKDELLPEILSYPFWGIPRVEVWRISLAAHRQSKTWLEVMLESAYTPIKQIADFLIELGVDAPSAPLEVILDRIIGAHISLQSEGDDVDQIDADVASVISVGTTPASPVFVSPFRQYYFSKDKFSHARAQYLMFLSSLRVFVQALREYNGVHISAHSTSTTSSTVTYSSSQGRMLQIKDLVTFVEMYQKNGLHLNDRSPFVTARNAVQLMSAHASKGLEFKVVFVLSCQDDVWAGKGRSNKLNFPINIAIEPAGDNEDDQLRLFYVALTRAKEHLYLTSHQIKETGKPAQDLRFLVGVIDPDTSKVASTVDELITPEVLETTALQYRTADFYDAEEALLKSILENYKLSVTHLNNFLNIARGGPTYFLEQNLLRFPQSKSISGAYGSAVHGALEFVLHHLKDTKQLATTEVVIDTFATLLRKQKLHPQDADVLLERGTRALTVFMKEKVSSFRTSDIPEMDFGREHVVIGTVLDADGVEREVCVTGKIDKVSPESGSVHDYKTGKTISSLEDPDRDDEEKAFLYTNQLVFYKMLIEQSGASMKYPELRGVSIDTGTIDFVEPVSRKSGIVDVKSEVVSLSIALTDGDVTKLKKLICAVYARIMQLNFEIPAEIQQKYAAGQYTKDVDAMKEFVEVLVRE